MAGRSTMTRHHFNPRSPHGERPQMMTDTCWMDAFQSTLPARGATLRHRTSQRREADFNPRSPHGERRAVSRKPTGTLYFNPRSPHGERPAIVTPAAAAQYQFQSTLPARGATLLTTSLTTWTQFQSTLPARGATVTLPRIGHSTENFNPRSPHGERRVAALSEKSGISFQSTLPARGATEAIRQQRTSRTISIHAPRTGSDRSATTLLRVG